MVALAGLATLTAICLTAATVGAVEIYVPDDYETITEAALVAQPGDSVIVRPGYYHEYVRIKPGTTITSTDGPDETYIGSMSWEFPAIRFLRPEGPANESSQAVVARLFISQSYDYGVPSIISENPNTVIDSCRVYSAGPDDNWGVPMIHLVAGGVVRRSYLFDRNISSVVLTTDPGAELLVEDCIIGFGGYLWGFSDFGDNSVSIFKNNTFVFEIINTTVYEEFGTNLTVVFVNNIMAGYVWCDDAGDLPDSLDFRHNCYYDVEPPVEECAPSSGGNFFADPLFCDFADDPRLEPESPCMGTGENGEDIGARIGICDPLTSVDDWNRVAGGPWISPAHPNPTTGPVELVFAEPVRSGSVKVEVLDISGRIVRLLARDAIAGNRVTWDGLLADRSRAPTGVYFVRVRHGAREATRKVTLIQ